MASLVEKLDKVAAENSAEKMHVVVNLVGVDEQTAKDFAGKLKLGHSVISITDEKNAQRFKVDSAAELTVMHYRNKTVAANHALAPGQLDDAAIATIVKSAGSMLGDAAKDSGRKK